MKRKAWLFMAPGLFVGGVFLWLAAVVAVPGRDSAHESWVNLRREEVRAAFDVEYRRWDGVWSQQKKEELGRRRASQVIADLFQMSPLDMAAVTEKAIRKDGRPFLRDYQRMLEYWERRLDLEAERSRSNAEHFEEGRSAQSLRLRLSTAGLGAWALSLLAIPVSRLRRKVYS